MTEEGTTQAAAPSAQLHPTQPQAGPRPIQSPYPAVPLQTAGGRSGSSSQTHADPREHSFRYMHRPMRLKLVWIINFLTQ